MFKKFNNMKVREKLNFGYMLVIAMTIVAGVVSLVSIWTLNRTMDDFVNRSNAADTAAKMCRVDINIAARNVREMALKENTSSYPAYKKMVSDNLDAMKKEIKNLKKTGVVDAKLCKEYETVANEWSTTAMEIISMIEKKERDDAVTAIFRECVPQLEKIIALSEQVQDKTHKSINKAAKESEKVFWISLIVILLVVVIATVIAMVLSRKIIESIVKPLKEIERVSNDLTNGNLHSHFAYRSKDELGSVADSLRTAIERLSSYVDDIAKMMNEFAEGNFEAQPEVEWRGDFGTMRDSVMKFEKNMANTVHGIQRVAMQVSNGAGQIAGSSAELALGANEQAQVTAKLAGALDKAIGELNKSVGATGEATKKVSGIGTELVRSDQKMEEMIDAMQEISEASHKISQIIDTINEIASQTELLALNASIEAARAGEAGRGFAVVADQVSALAAQSALAANQSNELIDSSLAAVQKGIDIANETAEQLQQVVDDSEVIIEDITKTTEVLKVQAGSFVEIMDDVDQINGIVQTNSATSEQCAASSEEMNGQAEVLEGLIEKLRVGDASEDEETEAVELMDETETIDEMEVPDEMETIDEMEVPDEMETMDGMEAPDEMETMDGTEVPDEMDDESRE